MNGKVIPWDQCVLHGRSQAAFFAANVFEGTRAYWNQDEGELYLFKNDEHLQRLARSMKTMRLDVPYSMEQITQGSLDLLRANSFREDVHFVTVAYFGMGVGFDAMGAAEETGVYISAIAQPQKPLLWSGGAACVSSWRRIADDVLPPRVKSGANYGNSRLAQREAKLNGYDTAIILNSAGKVAEAPGACLMMVRDGEVVTPPVTAGILESITRSTLIDLFRRELGMTVVERDIDRTELYAAEEVFLCGSGWEIFPMTSVDRLPVGSGEPGPVTRRMQDTYFSIARGKNPAYRHWLTPVYAGVREPAAVR
jgi:branched-chain amino acid aminotransferase